MLGGNGVGDKGTAHLASVIEQNSPLKVLDLSNNKLTAEAGELLASALEMPPLAWGTFDDSSAEDKAATRKSSASETRNDSRTGGAHQPSTNIV